MAARAALLLAGLLAVAGCAGTQPVRGVSVAPPDPAAVTIEARNYSFAPSFLTLPVDTRIILFVKNLSRSPHNITIEGPRGRTVRSVDLPPKEGVPVHITLKVPGDYIFYCDRLFHSSFGMKGRIRAE